MSAEAATPRLRAHGAAVAGIALLVLFAYSNALRGAFVFDDVRMIAANATVRDLANYFGGLRGYHETPNRWVAYATFALNYRLGGLDVTGYHAVNVAIHLANALLVYALVALTFATPRVRASRLAPHAAAIAFLAAALFATHPLQTQAVTYVVQRLTSLATFFYLAAVALYAAARLAGPRAPRRGRAAYVLALAAALLAAKTKEIAFTLPFAIALYELSFLDGPWRRRALALAPFLATAAVIPLTLVDVRQPLARALSDASDATRVQTPIGRVDYLRTELAVVARYLRLVAFPSGQSLDHDFPIYRSFLAPAVALAGALLGGLGALAGWLYARTAPARARGAVDPAARVAAFGVAWFFLALTVESSVIPIADVIYEHRVYLPSAGLFAAVAVAAAFVLERAAREAPARAIALAGVLAALLLASLTLQRNTVWADDLTLWSDAAAKAPAKMRPHLNLGTALAAAGRRRAAAEELRRAVELDPGSSWARAQLGAALLSLGRPAEAEPQLRESLRLQPDDPEALFNLAMMLTSTGRPDEARPWFKRFLTVAPSAYADARRIAAARAGP